MCIRRLVVSGCTDTAETRHHNNNWQPIWAKHPLHHWRILAQNNNTVNIFWIATLVFCIMYVWWESTKYILLQSKAKYYTAY